MPDPASRLYLVTPVLDDPAAFAPQLEAALTAGDVACVLFRMVGDDTAVKAALKAVIAATQARGVAALLAGDDTRLMGHVGADGLHLPRFTDDLVDTVRGVKPARIVGCGGFETRDDAMQAGEGNVDYVMFGDTLEGSMPASWEERLERVAWWAEIFQVPCVAVAHAPQEVEPFAACGAEFVALGPWMWDGPEKVVDVVEAATTALQAGEEALVARVGASA